MDRDLFDVEPKEVLLQARKGLSEADREALDIAIQRLALSVEKRIYAELLEWLENSDFALYEILGYSKEYIAGMQRGRRIVTRQVRARAVLATGKTPSEQGKR